MPTAKKLMTPAQENTPPANFERNAKKNSRSTSTKRATNKRQLTSQQRAEQTIILQADGFERNDASGFGRIVINGTSPKLAENHYLPRVELGETFTVTAHCCIDGRTNIAVDAIVRNKRGTIKLTRRMTCENAGLDYYTVQLSAGEHSTSRPWDSDFSTIMRQCGIWTVTLEAWEDIFASWLHDARIKVSVHDDLANVFATGERILQTWLHYAPARLTATEKATLHHAQEILSNTALSDCERLAGVTTAKIEELHRNKPLRKQITESNPLSIMVERPQSSFASWYQFFPRSEGASIDPNTGDITQGTFATAREGLDRAKKQGFSIVYIPPIFPVGTTHRKGKNNALIAQHDDPGSPWGIGSSQGGHDTVDPHLGSMADFDQFVDYAHSLGLEIALDFALQCSPDHPWVHEHPEWFIHKPDGSIAYAENPPKKYQDIYPIDFTQDFNGLRQEVVRILKLWIDHGVTIFRVDNPHTKPVRFWQDVIADIHRSYPHILFLAEAFTRPTMMRALSYAGFTQSHCYFPWRNTKEELAEYLQETHSESAYWQHNSFWPTTPDILTAFLRDNGIAGHAIRAVLAALGSPSWGIYNGYELIENEQRNGVEEQNNNEKYEIKVRNWNDADAIGISALLTRLNEIRNAHIATQSYHNLTVLPTTNPNMLAWVRHTPAELSSEHRADTLITVVNLDAQHAQQGMVTIPDEILTTIAQSHYISESATHSDIHHLALHVQDELTERTFVWGKENFVSLAPWSDVAHIMHIVDVSEG